MTDDRKAPAGDQKDESRSGSREDAPLPSRTVVWQTWWPAVDTVEAAERVARYGFWGAVINAALTGLFLGLLLSDSTTVSVASSPALVWWAIADIAISVFVAAGLWVYSPVAAAAGLVLFVASKLLGWLVLAATPDLTAILIAAMFAYFYVLGVRGAFARRKLLAATTA